MVNYVFVVYTVEIFIFAIFRDNPNTSFDNKYDNTVSKIMNESVMFFACLCTYIEFGLSPMMLIPTIGSTIIGSIVGALVGYIKS